jgi:hypothetical protein
MRSRPRNTGPTPDVVDAVLERDQHSCVCCGENLQGIRGRDWSLHHRRGRGMGSTRRPESNLPANLVAVCGTGNTGCHGWLTENPALGREQGLVLRQHEDPTKVPAATWYGVALFDNEGGMRLIGGAS